MENFSYNTLYKRTKFWIENRPIWQLLVIIILAERRPRELTIQHFLWPSPTTSIVILIYLLLYAYCIVRRLVLCCLLLLLLDSSLKIRIFSHFLYRLDSNFQIPFSKYISLFLKYLKTHSSLLLLVSLTGVNFCYYFVCMYAFAVIRILFLFLCWNFAHCPGTISYLVLL